MHNLRPREEICQLAFAKNSKWASPGLSALCQKGNRGKNLWATVVALPLLVIVPTTTQESERDTFAHAHHPHRARHCGARVGEAEARCVWGNRGALPTGKMQTRQARPGWRAAVLAQGLPFPRTADVTGHEGVLDAQFG